MVCILSTGGTIEGFDYPSKNFLPEEAPVDIANFLDNAKLSIIYTIEKVFAKDSRFITPDDREVLVQKISTTKTHRILITHGTLTMIETAQYLGKLYLHKTIVLTGAFVLGTEAHTDAPFNLGYALCALQTLGPGVYVAMHGNIFSWNNVTKNTTTDRFEQLRPASS